MTRIAILSPSLTSGDAVSNDVVGMYQVTSRLGYNARVFAEGWTLTTPKVWPANSIESFLKKPTDLLLYHYSRGWTPGLRLIQEGKWRTAIKYHNVTPPEFFAAYNKDYANMCSEGRAQLNAIARAGCDAYMSASAYSMRELLAAGAGESQSFVVPPFHHIDRLEALEPDMHVVKAFNDAQTNVCMIGRVSPNKGHPALIEAFAAYHHDYNSASRLLIVGKEETRLARYSRLLREMVRRLNLEGKVVFTGEVSDAALKAYYLVSQVFLMTSHHEGFCVPLVEAMAMRLPIVAYASSAIPGTVANAGLVWEDHNPYLLAESIDSIVENQSVSQALTQLGWKRYRENFTNEKIEADLLNALGGLI